MRTCLNSCTVLGFMALLQLLRAQQITPFQGQNQPPEGGLDVFVSASLDHMLSIDDQYYQFEAVIPIYLSWRDLSAAEIVQNETELAKSTGICNRPCSEVAQWNPGDPCCQGIFLPTFNFINIRGSDQNRIVRSEIDINRETGAVGWWARTQGTYYATMQFKAFPFDTQYLTVQVLSSNNAPNRGVRVIGSASSNNLYNPASGDLVSGWEIDSVTIVTSEGNVTAGEAGLENLSTPSHPDDPWPLKPTDESQVRVPYRNPIAGSSGFYIIIQVHRISLYYVLNSIIPVILIVWLSLFVFAISPAHLDTRLGVVVTLTLALTALQFVVSSSLPASTTVVPTQQIILISYFVLAIIALLSVCTYQLTVIESRKKKKERIRQARQEFEDRWVEVKQSLSGQMMAARAGNTWLKKRKGATGEKNAEVGNQTTSDHFGGMGIFISGGEDDEKKRTKMKTRPTSPSDEEDGRPTPFEQPADATQKEPNCFKLTLKKSREMWQQTKTNPDYAFYVAERIDLWCFIFVLISYNVSVVVLLVVQSYDDPTLQV